MTRISATNLCQNPPAYLKRVEAGEELRWLERLRGSITLGDVVGPITDGEWSGDDAPL